MRIRLRRLGHQEEVSVVDHLDELRNRLLVSLICLGVAFAVAFWRHQDLIRLLLHPVPGKIEPRLLVTGVGEQFAIAVKLSFWAAVIVALPVLFYQLYAYIVPALAPETQRHLRPLLLLVPSLFIAGVVFCYFLVIPPASRFLLTFDANLYTVLPRAQDWFEFCIVLMIVLGLIFEMPAAVLMLARLGIVTSALMRRYRRHAIVINAVVAAALPGVDPVTTVLELIPLLVLYELSILLARIAEPRSEPDAVGTT
jgi:sec-independent protein translocase protein TatC